MPSPDTGISFLVATYGMAAHVTDMLDSVRRAMDAADQLVIVDDGSKDATAQLCQQWIDKNAVSATLIQQANRGVCASRNTALRVASRPYVLFLDGDDVLNAESLAKGRHILNAMQPDVLEFDFDYWEPDKHPALSRSKAKTHQPHQLITSQDEILICTLHDRAWALWGRIIHRSLLETAQGGLFFPESLRIDDVPCTPRILSKARSLYYLPEPILQYRMDVANSLSKQRTARHCLDIGRSTASALNGFDARDRSAACDTAISLWAGRMFYEALRMLMASPERSPLLFTQLYEESLACIFPNPSTVTAALLRSSSSQDRKIAREISRFAKAPRLYGHWRWISSKLQHAR